MPSQIIPGQVHQQRRVEGEHVQEAVEGKIMYEMEEGKATEA